MKRITPEKRRDFGRLHRRHRPDAYMPDVMMYLLAKREQGMRIRLRKQRGG